MATEIVVTPSLRKRASVIKHFIFVAQACRELKNFNTLLAITAGLNLAVIQRLRKTWRVSFLLKNSSDTCTSLLTPLCPLDYPIENYGRHQLNWKILWIVDETFPIIEWNLKNKIYLCCHTLVNMIYVYFINGMF